MLCLCWNVLPILRFVLHFSRYEQKFVREWRDSKTIASNFEFFPKIVLMNCAKLRFQFYIFCSTPSQNRKPQSFETVPLNFFLKMMSMNCASNFTFYASFISKMAPQSFGTRPPFRIFPQKWYRWIVFDLCWIVFPILYFVLHIPARYGATKFRYEPQPPSTSNQVENSAVESC